MKVRRFEGAKIVLNFAWWTLREVIYHAMVAKDVKVVLKSSCEP